MSARQVISNVIGQDVANLDSEMQLGSIPGWDSMKVVHLVLRIEETINRELSEGEMEKLQTVADIERLLATA